MMNPTQVMNHLARAVKSNRPEILTGLSVAGVVSTSYLAAKAGFRAFRIVEKEQARIDLEPKSHPLDVKEKATLTWKLYIPPAVSGGLTIACIIGASKANGRRTAAAVTAYSLTEKMFGEYKDKVAEQMTANKQQKVMDEIAQDRINAKPPPEPTSSQVVIIGPGQVLCCEMRTMRYFHSDMESLRQAMNAVNHRLNTAFGSGVSLTEFYDLIDLEPTSESEYNGWDGDDQLDLTFHHGLAPDGRPCLTFDYNYVRPL